MIEDDEWDNVDTSRFWPELCAVFEACKHGRKWSQDWSRLIDSFLVFEKKHGYEDNAKLGLSGTSRPSSIHAFQKGRRAWTKSWDSKETPKTFWPFWKSLQPAARLNANNDLLRPEEVEWDGLETKCGRNGISLIIGVLLWWGDVIFARGEASTSSDDINTERLDWGLAVQEVTWTLDHMVRTARFKKSLSSGKRDAPSEPEVEVIAPRKNGYRFLNVEYLRGARISLPVVIPYCRESCPTASAGSTLAGAAVPARQAEGYLIIRLLRVYLIVPYSIGWPAYTPLPIHSSLPASDYASLTEFTLDSDVSSVSSMTLTDVTAGQRTPPGDLVQSRPPSIQQQTQSPTIGLGKLERKQHLYAVLGIWKWLGSSLLGELDLGTSAHPGALALAGWVIRDSEPDTRTRVTPECGTRVRHPFAGVSRTREYTHTPSQLMPHLHPPAIARGAALVHDAALVVRRDDLKSFSNQTDADLKSSAGVFIADSRSSNGGGSSGVFTRVFVHGYSWPKARYPHSGGHPCQHPTRHCQTLDTRVGNRSEDDEGEHPWGGDGGAGDGGDHEEREPSPPSPLDHRSGFPYPHFNDELDDVEGVYWVVLRRPQPGVFFGRTAALAANADLPLPRYPYAARTQAEADHLFAIASERDFIYRMLPT
ncbi:hypothetical protein BDZ89DRAFT_1214899 [Hymenopellis radicata]|nr:hypothetical protein BDZ89DRAFT_1214899 [Hymenopellis radicata]